MIETNIINQMVSDTSEGIQRHWIDCVKEVYRTYINSKNNGLYRVENEEMLKEQFFYASEISLFLFGKKHLEVGTCLRKTYFKLKNSYSTEYSINSKEEMEKNNLCKEQLIRKIKLCGIYEEYENKIEEYEGLKIKTTIDGFLYDYNRQKEYAILIKPVNGSSKIISKKVFYENKLLKYNMPEVLTNMLILKKPIKVLYVDKNNSEKIKEVNCGFSQGVLTVNDEVTGINYKEMLQNIRHFYDCYSEEKVPEKIFTDSQIDFETALEMKSNEIIEEFEFGNLINGEIYNNFLCKDCVYKSLCDITK